MDAEPSHVEHRASYHRATAALSLGMGHVSARARTARRLALASAMLCVTAVFVIPTTHAAERSDLHSALGASAGR